MASIGIHNSSNMGGIVALFIANIADLATPFEPLFSKPSGHIVESPLDFSFGKQMDFIGFAQDKGNYAFEQKMSAQGMLYVDRVTVTIPEISPELHEWVYDRQWTKNILIAVDNNFKAVAIGSSNYPVLMTVVAGTGSSPRGENQYTLNFECQKPYLSRFYLLEEIVPPDLPTRKVYDEGFTFGYLRTWS